jgi:hypothetical protein
MGQEQWDDVKAQILPVLKPRDYIEPGKATEHLLTMEWLAEVVICYVIRNKKFYWFVTDWDLRRWGIASQLLRQKDGGRVILVQTNDSLTSSLLLHPDLHRLFSGPLGIPFWAGIPDRETLVVFSDRHSIKQRIGRRLAKDYRSSA